MSEGNLFTESQEAIEALNRLFQGRPQLLMRIIKEGFNVKIPLIFGAKEAFRELVFTSGALSVAYTYAEVLDFCASKDKQGYDVTPVEIAANTRFILTNPPPSGIVYDCLAPLFEAYSSSEHLKDNNPAYYTKKFLMEVLPEVALRMKCSRGMHKQYPLLALTLLQTEAEAQSLLKLRISNLDRKSEDSDSYF